jgi:hypothetical protein
MSLVDVRELVFDSPLRARSLLTVRAAISSARLSDAPYWRSLSLMLVLALALAAFLHTTERHFIHLCSAAGLSWSLAGSSAPDAPRRGRRPLRSSAQRRAMWA